MRKRDRAKAPTPSRPRPITLGYLRNAALHYVSQRAASTAMVRQMLERRAMRRLAVRALDDDTQRLVQAAISELLDLGLLDDVRFAESRVATLAGRGASRARIGMALRAKGVDRETIEQVVGEDLDALTQARRLVARKRLGPFRAGATSPETRRKDLAALARAGFAFDIARRALEEPDEDPLPQELP